MVAALAGKEVRMRKGVAAAGSALFFACAPGVVAGLIPWLLTDRYHMPLSSNAGSRIVAALLIGAGLAVLVHAFVRFVTEGFGTPAPVAPTEHLVIGGLYRHVRNPMYLAVVGMVIGQAILFASPALLAYAALVATAMVSFVRFYEEPTLARRYGAAYEAYRNAVPGWLPRLTPWRP